VCCPSLRRVSRYGLPRWGRVRERAFSDAPDARSCSSPRSDSETTLAVACRLSSTAGADRVSARVPRSRGSDSATPAAPSLPRQRSSKGLLLQRQQIFGASPGRSRGGRVMARCRVAREAAFHHTGGADPQPGRRGQRRRRSRRSPAVERCRRCFCSLASSRSSLSPTSRNIRSTTAPRPRVISAMASTSPVNPPTRAAQIEPATTSAAADPNAKTRGRGATAPRYRFDQPPSRSQSPGTRVPLRARRPRRQCGRLEAARY
jgi:hypothetical protein